MPKGDYLTKPMFGTPRDDIEREVAAWLEKNAGVIGESVMRSLADLVKRLIAERQTDEPMESIAALRRWQRHHLLRQYGENGHVLPENLELSQHLDRVIQAAAE